MEGMGAMGMNRPRVIAEGKTPSQWVVELAGSGVEISERTLREKARAAGLGGARLATWSGAHDAASQRRSSLLHPSNADNGNTGRNHANATGGSRTEIDAPPFDPRSTVIDADGDGLASIRHP